MDLERAGKTTISAWLVRRADVRDRFEAILWCPLGQNPSLAKLQDQLHKQLTGLEINSEKQQQDERVEALKAAMAGRKLLLVLDDM